MKVYVVISEDRIRQYSQTSRNIVKIFASQEEASEFAKEYWKTHQGKSREIRVDCHDLVTTPEVEYVTKFILTLVHSDGTEKEVGSYPYYGGAYLSGDDYVRRGKCNSYYIKTVKSKVPSEE